MQFPASWAINWGQKSVLLVFTQENAAFIQLSIYQPHNQFLQPMNKRMKSKFKLLHINNFWGTLSDKWSSCGGLLTRKAQIHGGGHRVNFDHNLPSSCFVVQYNSLISMIYLRFTMFTINVNCTCGEKGEDKTVFATENFWSQSGWSPVCYRKFLELKWLPP